MPDFPEQTIVDRPWFRNGLGALLLGLAVTIAFGASLRYGFVWDDHGLITHTASLHASGHFSKVFLQGFWSLGTDQGQDTTRSFYRPLISLSFYLDHALWKDWAGGYHLTNLLLYTLLLILVYRFTLSLATYPGVAFTATLLFAVHPTHVANVCWIAGRTDTLCGIFYLLALTLYHHSYRREQRSIAVPLGTAMAYLLALLSKEMALSLPFIFLLIHVTGPRKTDWSRVTFTFVLLILATILYALLRTVVLGSLMPAPAFGTWGQRLASLPMVFVRYLGILLHLVPVDPHYDDSFIMSVTWRHVAFFAVTACYVAVWSLMRRQSLYRFCMAWIPLTLLPVCNLGTFGDVLYADRFLLIPSVGFALLFSLALREGINRLIPSRLIRQILLTIFLGSLVGTQVLLARFHTRYWADDLALFSHAATTSPRSAYIAFNHGKALADRGICGEALNAYRRAVTLHPDYAEAFTNMGHLLTRMGRLEEALKAFEAAYAANDRSTILYSNWADAWRRSGDLDKAILNYRRSISIQPTATAFNNLGECLLARKDPEGAAELFRLGLIQERSVGLYNNLGLALLDMNNATNAIRALRRALDTSPAGVQNEALTSVHFNMARALAMAHQPHAARAHALKALDMIRAGHDPFGPDSEPRQILEKLAGTLSK